MRLMKRRRSTTLLNEESVRPECDGCQQSTRPCRSKDNPLKGPKLTGQEAVKLHQELEVHIVALGSLAVRVPLVVLAQIDTCKRGRLRQPLGPVCSFGRSTEPRGYSVQLQAPLS